MAVASCTYCQQEAGHAAEPASAIDHADVLGGSLCLSSSHPLSPAFSPAARISREITQKTRFHHTRTGRKDICMECLSSVDCDDTRLGSPPLELLAMNRAAPQSLGS